MIYGNNSWYAGEKKSLANDFEMTIEKMKYWLSHCQCTKYIIK